MNSKKASFIAAAALLALAAASCGKVDKESSDVALDINTATSEVTVTSEDDSDAVTTAAVTTSAVTTKEGETTTKKGYSAKPSGDTHTTAAPHAADPTQAAPEPADPEPQSPPEPEPPAPTDPPTEPPTEPPAEDVKFNFDSLQSDAAPFISGLPVNFTKGTGAGCVTGNYDVVSYRCPEITIDCYVDGGIEYIFSVTINSNVCSTAEGITVGSSRAEVEAAYGVGEGGPESVLYKNGSKELWIDYSGDSVASIQFYIAV